jgi:hypothetical protein
LEEGEEVEDGASEPETEGTNPREKKVKANDNTDLSAYIILGSVGAVLLAAGYAFIRYRKA